MSRLARTLSRLAPAVIGLAAAVVPAPAWGAQATLSWDQDTDPTLQAYRVHYDRDSGAPYAGTDAAEGPSPVIVPLAALTDPAHPSFTLTGLDSCVQYYFAIQAVYAAGESGLSPEASAVLVAAPASVTVTPTGDRSLRVSWPGPPAGDSGTIPTYRIHYDVDGGQPYEGNDAAEGASPVVLQTSTLFDPLHPSQDLTQLRAGQTYYVAVESVCDGGAGKLSGEASGATAGQEDAGTPPEDGPVVEDGGAAGDGPGPPGDGGTIYIDAGSCGCRAAGARAAVAAPEVRRGPGLACLAAVALTRWRGRRGRGRGPAPPGSD
ncbi:MAG: fibronectin type III domain-containing protein [Deltaproteobacteria bacterium]|nr:fibronectin type III domain-containing protein [Deltaproteobacteria bacterium]